MKLKEFTKTINSYPIRIIEEHVIVLSGVNTKPYEEILQKHGCTKSEWSDLIHGQVHLGTYVVVPKPIFNPGKIDPAIFELYCMEFTCEYPYGEKNCLTAIVDWVINEYEEMTGEKAPPYEEWSDDNKDWFTSHCLQEEILLKRIITQMIAHDFHQ